MKIIPALFTFFLFVALWSNVKAQFNLPAGYAIQDGLNGKNQIRSDFNGDGKQDLFAVIQKGQESTKFFAAISEPNGYLRITHDDLDYIDCCGSIEQKGAIIKVYSNGMRYFEHYTFRYNKTSKTFDFIGYDDENLGNASLEGVGSNSINLLTGTHISHKYYPDLSNPAEGKSKDVTRKYKMPQRYTLTDFPAAKKWIEGRVSQ